MNWMVAASNQKSFEKRIGKQTQCLESAADKEGKFGKLVQEGEQRQGLRKFPDNLEFSDFLN